MKTQRKSTKCRPYEQTSRAHTRRALGEQNDSRNQYFESFCTILRLANSAIFRHSGDSQCAIPVRACALSNIYSNERYPDNRTLDFRLSLEFGYPPRKVSAGSFPETAVGTVKHCRLSCNERTFLSTNWGRKTFSNAWFNLFVRKLNTVETLFDLRDGNERAKYIS